MITQISGRLIEKTPTYVVIECNGIGYRIHVSLQTYSLVEGESCKLFTHLSYMNTFHVGTTALSAGAGTVSGFLSLTSTDGSAIEVSDGPRDSGTGLADTILGFASVNEHGSSAKGVSVGTVDAATSSLAALDAAIDKVSQFRAGFGAYENRLDATINNLTTLKVNTDAARSRIEDADFAQETTNMTKSQILSQAATSMLAQANSSKQNLLALLQG